MGQVITPNGIPASGLYVGKTATSSFEELKSLLLGGTDEYVNADTAVSDLATDTVGTFSIWVKPVDGTPATNESILSFGDENGNEFLDFLVLTTGKVRARLRVSGTNQWVLETDAAAVATNTWTMLSVSQNGTEPTILVNGVAVAQTFTTSTDKTAWYNDMTGFDVITYGANRFNTAISNYFNGNIDEPSFWDSALTAAELLAVYNGGAPIDIRDDLGDYTSSANLVTWHRMGDDPGDNYNSTVANEWFFVDPVSGNGSQTVNCEEADVEEDVPT